MIEKAVMLGPRRAIVGVLTTPETRENRPKTAVLILNAGLIHHAGPGRIHVKLARSLANMGISSIRFDYSGVGDSPVRTDNLHVLEVATQEPREVMNDLSRKGYESFILVGICSGGYCAFKTALLDQRVIGAVAINTMDLSGKTEVDTRVREQRYFKESIFSLRAWKNLVTGKVNYGHLFSTILARLAVKNNKQADDQVLSEFDKISQNGQRLLFLFSGNDVRVNYLEVLLGNSLERLKNKGTVSKKVIPKADHVFLRNKDQHRLIDIISDWIESLSVTVSDEMSVVCKENAK